MPRLHALLAAALLSLMAVLAWGAALRESVSVDEVAHIGAGVSYLQKLDLRMNLEHPPLAKLLAALPLVLRGVHANYASPSWSFSDRWPNAILGEWSFGHWLLTRWNEPWATVAWARAPMLLLTLLLGLLLYLYGSRLADPRGGLLCLSAFVSMPAFLAFGPLVLTDIPIALFSAITMWTFAEMWRAPTRASVARFGLALAAALLTKFSAGLLLIACVAFALTLPRQARASRPQGWRNTGKGVLLAAFVVYAVYFILSWNQPATVVPRLLMPPLLYGTGLVSFGFTASRATFILGHAYSHGVPFYFPVLLLLKSPLAFLGLLLVALLLPRTKVSIAPGMELHWRAIWVFSLVFTIACLASQLDISIRHFTVPLASMILLLAPLPRRLEALAASGWRPASAMSWLSIALAAASVVTAIRAYPYYLPFLNSLTFGHPGYQLVNDSNLDWNQALPEARRFADSHNLSTVLIDEYGWSDPTVYVPQSRFWNCQQPTAADRGQWAVVSANMIMESHNCLWLFAYPHQALAGGSMYAVALPAAIPQAGAPGGPPLPADWHNFNGIPASWPDLRLIFMRGILDPQQLPAAMHQLITLGNPNG